MKNLIAGMAFAAFSAAFLYFSGDIRDPGFDDLGPRFVPRLALIPILLLSMILIFNGYREMRSADKTAGPSGFNVAKIVNPLLLLVELFLFIWALTTRALPFEVIGTVFVLVAGVTVAGFKDRRLLAWLAAVAVILPLVVGFVFKTYLYVNLP